MIFKIIKRLRAETKKNKKRRMYLHVGLHKTGTTAIQDFLFLNRDKLLSQGYLYPITEFHPLGQQRVAYAFNGEVNPHLDQSKVSQNEELFEKLTQVISQDNYQVLIVSSENFTPSGNKSVLKKIKHFFCEFDIKIVFYLRRQDSYKESLYREHIKLPNSETVSFKRFNVPYVLDYEKRLKPWVDVFGEQNIIVRSYDQLISEKADVINDFCEIIGLDISQYEKPKKNSNSTISNIAMELIRALNSLDIDHIERGRVNIAVRKFCDESDLKKVWRLSNNSKKILSKYSKSNTSVAERFLQGRALFNEEHKNSKQNHFVDKKELIEMFESYFSNQAAWPASSVSLSDAVLCITKKLEFQYPV